ncbi:MAG: hypothetical protein J3Q66DRAFT_387789 [Benniella sp.]|nr:MAG: hypothetical protein J3Q66DRAFT_387789 [Benniella sp.]
MAEPVSLCHDVHSGRVQQVEVFPKIPHQAESLVWKSSGTNHYISHVSLLPKRGVAALLLDGHIVQDVLAPNDHIYADTAAESTGSGARKAKITVARKASSPDGRKASSPDGRKASSPYGRKARVNVSRKAKASGARKERVRDVQGTRTSNGPGISSAIQQQPERAGVSHQDDQSSSAGNTYVGRPPQLVSADELMKPWKQEIALAEAMYETSNDKRQFLETWYRVFKQQELKFATEAEDARSKMAEMSDPDIANLLASWSSFYQHQSRLAAEKAGLTKLELRLMQQSQQ